MQTDSSKTKFIKTPADKLDERNSMLQKTLRDQPYDFTIAEEYPLVLSRNSEFSYSLFKESDLASHANLWPRQLLTLDNKTIPVGLIGNVATDPDFQKQGLTYTLFDHLSEEAQKQDLQALVLWSDLHSFYQKLGFQSLSTELRFEFNPLTLKGSEHKEGKFYLVEEGNNQVDLEELLSLRPKTATLRRSRAEFEELLKIPFTHLFVLEGETGILSYLIVGKGADMLGVVHEWGLRAIDDLHNALFTLGQLSGWEQLLLLSPNVEQLQKDLSSFLGTAKKHPMALYKPLGDVKFNKIAPFIWGLDSI